MHFLPIGISKNTVPKRHNNIRPKNMIFLARYGCAKAVHIFYKKDIAALFSIFVHIEVWGINGTDIKKCAYLFTPIAISFSRTYYRFSQTCSTYQFNPLSGLNLSTKIQKKIWTTKYFCTYFQKTFIKKYTCSVESTLLICSQPFDVVLTLQR